MRERSREERNEFELRRLHNLLLLWEDTRDETERAAGAATVCRPLRRYLADFHDLEARL